MNLRTFIHLRKILSYNKKHKSLPKTVELVTIYESQKRKIERIGKSGENIVEWQKKNVVSKIDSDYGFRVALSTETTTEPEMDENPTFIRLRKRYSYIVNNDLLKRCDWRYDLTVTKSSAFIDENHVNELKEEFYNKKKSLASFDSIDSYEIEVEYIGNKGKNNEYQLTETNLFKIYKSIITFILLNNKTDPARYLKKYFF